MQGPERNHWITCPACGSSDAHMEVYSDCVLMACGECDMNTRVDTHDEPTAI